MMDMSAELEAGKGRKPQANATAAERKAFADANLAKRGNGEPGADGFWLGGYADLRSNPWNSRCAVHLLLILFFWGGRQLQ